MLQLKKISPLFVMLGLFLFLSVETFCYAFFSSNASNINNTFKASAVFPLPSPKPGALVINEVFYNTTVPKPSSSPKVISISGNGAGSTKNINISNNSNCQITQSNSSSNSNSVTSNANSGHNSVSGNTASASTILTATASSTVNINNAGSLNIASCGATSKNPWIELYNGSNNQISINKYLLSTGTKTYTMNYLPKIKPKQFVLITTDPTTWIGQNIPVNTVMIYLFDLKINLNDHLILKDSKSAVLDALSWGTDTSIFHLNSAGYGHSLSRKVTGYDTDLPTDFIDLAAPTPGF